MSDNREPFSFASALKETMELCWPQRECFKCGLKACECDAMDQSQIARDEQSRKEILRAERDMQLENDPEYRAWLDSL